MEVTATEWEASSSLADDPEMEARTDMQEDMGVFETDAIHKTHNAPIDTHGDGAVRRTQIRGAGGRLVRVPYRERLDIGMYGIYVGNWSGRRRLQEVNDHIAADVVARCPAQIILAQEVDGTFVETLRDPRQSAEARSRPMASVDAPAVAGRGGLDDRKEDLQPWLVAVETDARDAAKGLIVAAKASRAQASTVLEVNTLFHREYKKNRKTCLAYSHLLAAQIAWLPGSKMHGLEAVQFLNVHFHNLAAKKAWTPLPLSSPERP